MIEIGIASLHLPSGHASITGVTPADDCVTPEIGPKTRSELPVAMGGQQLLFEGLDPDRNHTGTGPVVDLRYEPPAFDRYGFDWAGVCTSDVAAKAALYGWEPVTRSRAAQVLTAFGYMVPPLSDNEKRTRFNSVLWLDHADELIWYVPSSVTGFRYTVMRQAFVVRDTGDDAPPSARAEKAGPAQPAANHGSRLRDEVERSGVVPIGTARPA